MDFLGVKTVLGDFGLARPTAWVLPDPSYGSLQTHNGAAGLVVKWLRRFERRTASRGSANLQVRLDLRQERSGG